MKVYLESYLRYIFQYVGASSKKAKIETGVRKDLFLDHYFL